jgi:hypothetical protein
MARGRAGGDVQVAGQLGGLLPGGLLVGAGGQQGRHEPRLPDVFLDAGDQAHALGVAAAEPGRPDLVQDAGGQAELQQRHDLRSSSRIGSSGAIRANPIASRALPSSSSGTPVSWLTCR